MITFEYPLNERNRTLLRLEHLFLLLLYHTQAESKAASQSCIAYLLEISQLLARSDIKSTLVKELERQIRVLSLIKETPGIDVKYLEQILKKLTYSHQKLQAIPARLGKEIREDPFLKILLQQSTNTSGSYTFDLPRYHLWLHQKVEDRKAKILAWRKTLLPVSNAIAILLQLIRESSLPTDEIAEQGCFQQPLEQNAAIQLIRVRLPAEQACYPEIDAGKHRFNISFIKENDSFPLIQIQEDIPFQLTICKL